MRGKIIEVIELNIVYPIKDRNKIERLKSFMKNKGKYRELLMFTIAINTPLRITDILSMKWKNFLTHSEEIKVVNSRITVVKAGKSKEKSFVLTSSIYEALRLHFNRYPYISREDYVFASQKTKNGRNWPITRPYVWALLNKYAKAVGIKERIGVHTLRKTFGYHLYQKGVSINYIRKLLNEPTVSATLHYIDVSTEELERRVGEFLTLNL